MVAAQPQNRSLWRRYFLQVIYVVFSVVVLFGCGSANRTDIAERNQSSKLVCTDLDGSTYPVGSSWKCDCNTCSCTADRGKPEIMSTLMACGN